MPNDPTNEIERLRKVAGLLAKALGDISRMPKAKERPMFSRGATIKQIALKAVSDAIALRDAS